MIYESKAICCNSWILNVFVIAKIVRRRKLAIEVTYVVYSGGIKLKKKSLSLCLPFLSMHESTNNLYGLYSEWKKQISIFTRFFLPI